MNNPKFKIWDKVKSRNFFSTIIAIKINEYDNYKFTYKLFGSLADFTEEENLEKPTDYELKTYY